MFTEALLTIAKVYIIYTLSVQFILVTQSCPTLQPHGLQHTKASFTVSQSLFKLMSIESVMLPNHLILCCPLLLPPSNFPSISVFSNESAHPITWPKSWSFSFSISPSNGIQSWFHSGLTGLIPLLSNGLWRVFSSTIILKASILQPSAFFMVQLSHLYMTTEKTIVLTIWTFVGKVMLLLFNRVQRLLIAFLLRNKCLLIS